MASYLITGASRGLGLEFATQLSSLPTSSVSTIIATGRTQSTELQNLISTSTGKVVFVQMDVSDEASVEKAVPEVEKVLAGKGLDVLINNVGVMPWTTGGIAKMDDLPEVMSANVLTAHYAIRNFLPLLQKGEMKKIANISTTLGSLSRAADYMWGSAPAYKLSKAALNMLTIQYGLEYAKDGFAIFSISPGWVKTDLGGEGADLTKVQSVAGCLEKILSAGKEQNATFMNLRVKGFENVDGPNKYDGKDSPW